MEYSVIDKFVLSLIFFCGRQKDIVKDKKEETNIVSEKIDKINSNKFFYSSL